MWRNRIAAETMKVVSETTLQLQCQRILFKTSGRAILSTSLGNRVFASDRRVSLQRPAYADSLGMLGAQIST
jgi:hypothetical protein